MFQVNNRNTRTRCEVCSNLTIKTPERHLSRVFIVNFEHMSHLVLAFLLLTLNIKILADWVMNWRIENTLLDIRNPFPSMVIKVTFLKSDSHLP